MLDIKFIRENSEKIKETCANKGVKLDVARILELDEEKRENMKKLEEISAEKNKTTKIIPTIKDENEKKKLIADMKKIDEESDELKEILKKIETEFNDLMLRIPNIPFDDVPVGKDDTGNVVIKKVGKIPDFKFLPKDYLEIGKNLGLIDIERAAKVAGSRFGYLKNEAVLLEFALINFVFDVLVKKGFIPVLPPVMLKEEMARGTGYFEAADKKEAYFLAEDNLYLAGTSEQSLIAMHANEVFDEKELPKRYVAFSICFRREAGSYGKDTKGILRVHQFDKVEMVSFCEPEDSKKEHQLFLSIEENLMKALKLPYQVINICTGDLGLPAAAKYDIETWIPSENKYRETHSTSNCTDFQARRLNIRYRRTKDNKLEFVHTLNGTAFAIGRMLIAIIENYQQKDGSVKIPAVLKKYLPAFSEIKKK